MWCAGYVWRWNGFKAETRRGGTGLQYVWKKQKQMQVEPPKGEKTVRRQLAWAAGSESFNHRDPLYHITENFQQTFDEIGRRHAAQLAGETVGGFSRTDTQQELQESRTEPRGNTQKNGQQPDPTSAKGMYQRRDPGNQDMIRRFSETAFQRGTLAGAVMAGTGKMMLVSCLKRTVGQSQPVKEQQRRLFEGASQQRNVPGHSPDAVVFNRGFADSAVGLVVDTLRDARRVVTSMADLAQGKSDMGAQGGAQTLRKMYPFLDDSREKQLRTQYEERMQQTQDPEERQLLQNALVRTQALTAKKAQMRTEFINKLRLIADRANEALTLFETPGFSEELVRVVTETQEPPDEPPKPPSDGAEPSPDEGGDTHAPE